MTEPLASVSMITYNHAPFIGRAIDAIVQQKTSFPFELIIGEDCSTDGTRDIVLNYQREFPGVVRVLLSDTNIGMIENGYRTLKTCRGLYVAFCEGDDYWHDAHKLQKQVDYLQRHPDCGLVCSDYDVSFIDTGRIVSRWNRRHQLDPSQIDDVAIVLRGTPSTGILTCTVVTRRELIAHVVDSDPSVFRNPQQPAADTAMWAGMFRLAGIGYIDESLATYVRHTESATRSADVTRVLRTSILIKEQMLHLIDQYGVSAPERALHTKDLWRRRLKLAFLETDSGAAYAARQRLGSLSPLEWLQFWGARNRYLNAVLRPVVGVLCRTTIPPPARS